MKIVHTRPKTKVIVEQEEKFTLELTKDEAIAIAAVCGHLHGPNSTIRKVTDNIWGELYSHYGSDFHAHLDDKFTTRENGYIWLKE